MECKCGADMVKRYMQGQGGKIEYWYCPKCNHTKSPKYITREVI